MTVRTLQEALDRTVDLCRRGYRTADPAFYADISETLREHADAEGVAVLIRMSDGGPSLSSKRFAFPHIQDRATDLLEGLQAAAPIA